MAKTTVVSGLGLTQPPKEGLEKVANVFLSLDTELRTLLVFDQAVTPDSPKGLPLLEVSAGLLSGHSRKLHAVWSSMIECIGAPSPMHFWTAYQLVREEVPVLQLTSHILTPSLARGAIETKRILTSDLLSGARSSSHATLLDLCVGFQLSVLWAACPTKVAADFQGQHVVYEAADIEAGWRDLETVKELIVERSGFVSERHMKYCSTVLAMERDFALASVNLGADSSVDSVQDGPTSPGRWRHGGIEHPIDRSSMRAKPWRCVAALYDAPNRTLSAEELAKPVNLDCNAIPSDSDMSNWARQARQWFTCQVIPMTVVKNGNSLTLSNVD